MRPHTVSLSPLARADSAKAALAATAGFAVANIFILCALVLVCSSCKKEKPFARPAAEKPVLAEKTPGKNVLKIGAVIPLTGSTATYGQETLQGLQLAIRQINEKGPLNIQLVYEDNQGNPTSTRNAVQKMIEVDKVAVIVGAIASTNTFAAKPIATQAQVPLLTPASTHVDVTKDSPWVSRICYTDDVQGKVLARFARNDLKASTAAIIVDAKSDYSRGLADQFFAAFGSLGGRVVSQVSFIAGDKDFSAQITQIRPRKPEVVFVPAYYTDAALILRQAKEKGLHAIFIGPDGWDSPKLYEIGGPDVAGNFFSTHFSPDDTRSVVQEFVKAYREAYKGEVPGALAALGYDAGLALADAARRAKDLTPASMKDAINSIKGLEGVTGTITLDANRNAVKEIVIIETKADRGVLRAKIAP